MEQTHECHKCSPHRCHFDRCGEISCPSGTSRMAVGDFSTLSLNRAQIPISPYRHTAPLEMTCGATSFTVMEKGNKWHRYLPAPLSFRPQRSGVEKSHAGMEQTHECHKCSPPRCHFDRSGEISCPSGTSRMAVGDFSTLSLNRAQIPISPYLHAAPLEMTCGTDSFTVMRRGSK